MTSHDILQLRTLRATDVEDHDDHYVIKASGQGEPAQCPACGGTPLYRHGSNLQRYMDVPMHGKRVLIEIDRTRFRCNACGKTLFSSLPEMDAKRFTTSRLLDFVEQNCLRKTFAELSRDVGVDEKTVRHVFDDYVTKLKAETHFETPRILGIDELMIVGQYRAMITNIEQLSIYDMLPTRNKVDLITYFKTLPDKHKVEVVTMDMWSVYRQVATDQFPGRPVVADRWHVVRMANDALEKVRKAIRKTLDTRTRLRLKDDRHILLMRWHKLTEDERAKLEGWKTPFPALVDAYWVKEAFHTLYQYPSEDEAREAIRVWLDSLPDSVAWAFEEAANALRSWRTEILNHYRYPISNAYTESVNRLAKDMNRMGRGYSFEVIRARLVYEKQARKKTTQSVRSRRRPADEGMSMGRMTWGDVQSTGADVKVIEYGPHIPTLCDLLEQGYFED